jgi:hypothetical protein
VPSQPETLHTVLEPSIEATWLTHLRGLLEDGIREHKDEMSILVNNVLILLDIIERLSPGLTTGTVTPFPGDEMLPVEERAKAAAALDALPARLRNCWTPQFQLVPDTGRFKGLSCKVCKRWQDATHTLDCPVADMEKVLAVRT